MNGTLYAAFVVAAVDAALAAEARQADPGPDETEGAPPA